MAIVLERYAIKEVADVMFYELDSKGAPSAPVLYLDTLKTSTISQSSEVVDARGGKGNVKLLSWDTNKEITLELTDAVFSAKSLAIMFGGEITYKGNTQEVLKTLKADQFEVVENGNGALHFKINGNTYQINANQVAWFKYVEEAGQKAVVVPIDLTDASKPSDADFGTFDLLDAKGGANYSDKIVSNGLEINITAEFGDNTYYITGDTYARNVASGKDEFLQFIIPKGKVSAEDVSLTMEADGDPAEFTMNVQCLKSESGSMIKLVKYSLGSSNNTAKDNKGAASVLDYYAMDKDHRSPWVEDSARISGKSLNLNKGGSEIDISEYDPDQSNG